MKRNQIKIFERSSMRALKESGKTGKWWCNKKQKNELQTRFTYWNTRL